MARIETFTFRVDDTERQMIAGLSKRLQRLAWFQSPKGKHAHSYDQYGFKPTWECTAVLNSEIFSTPLRKARPSSVSAGFQPLKGIYGRSNKTSGFHPSQEDTAVLIC